MTNSLAMAQALDSELLRTFLAVADSGSVSAGAERIFRSQSATSLQIKRLEELLGQPVFVRHGRGVILTPAGERLRPVATRVIGMLDSTLAEMRSNPVQGVLRMGIPDEFGHTVLPHALAAFAREHPRVELLVQSALSAEYPDALDRGELDIAVYDSDSAAPANTILSRQRIRWAVARHVALTEQDPLPLALFDRNCWWRDRALQSMQDMQRPFRVVYTCETVAGVLAAVRAGIAVGLLYADDLGDNLVELGIRDGFPAMPDTHLTVACRNGLNAKLADAMIRALQAAFARPGKRR